MELAKKCPEYVIRKLGTALGSKAVHVPENVYYIRVSCIMYVLVTPEHMVNVRHVIV